jgi:DNA-binding MarR family transcriptional regulator
VKGVVGSTKMTERAVKRHLHRMEKVGDIESIVNPETNEKVYYFPDEELEVIKREWVSGKRYRSPQRKAVEDAIRKIKKAGGRATPKAVADLTGMKEKTAWHHLDSMRRAKEIEKRRVPETGEVEYWFTE